MGIDEGDLESLPEWDAYAERLGANMYDTYASAHAMRMLGRIPFYAGSNPGYAERFNAVCAQIESMSPPEIVAQLHRWQDPASHPGDRRPITGMVGRELLVWGRHAEAEPLLRVAAESVTPYGSWELQYTYFALLCRGQLGGLSEADLDWAREKIERGRFIVGAGFSSTGAAERFTGELLVMVGEPGEAVDYLVAAGQKLTGLNRLAADTTLMRALVVTGQPDQARRVIDAGIRENPEFADRYRGMLR